MDLSRYHERTRTKGVNRLLYWPVRVLVVAFAHVYWRPSFVGKNNVPGNGPFIFASNHRSFLDPFIIAMMHRRPTYFVAKKELFRRRSVGWFLNRLGAFPVDRGHSDLEMMETARCVLKRGDALMIFPEGTRVRPGPLGSPHKGAGRLALETHALVLPCAIIGTENIRTNWRIRPKKIRVRAGRAIEFPEIAQPSKEDADAVIDRVWPCVELLWEWLGGELPEDHRGPPPFADQLSVRVRPVQARRRLSGVASNE